MLRLLEKWLPVNAAAHGPELDSMTALVHWLMALLFVGWSLYFTYVLFRFRAGRNKKASYEGSKGKISTWVEIGIIAAEAVLLVVFAIPAWARWVTPPPPESRPLTVSVVAEQFAWNVHYPGPDGVFGRRDVGLVDASNPLGLDRGDEFAKDDITTINQLHLEVDRPVTVLLTSKDVIHSFGLPVMRVKQDAIPGLEIPVHFTPVEVTPEEAKFPKCAAGKACWEIACAQLCGLGHYRMRGFMMVHSKADFDAWMAAEVAKVMPPLAAPAAAGSEGEAGATEATEGAAEAAASAAHAGPGEHDHAAHS